MKVVRDLSELKLLDKSVVTTGTFDGVHLGHRAVLQTVLDRAKEIGGKSLLLTFHPHPRVVLQQDTELKLLTTLEEKIALLQSIGLDYLVILPFTKAFSRTTSLDFVRDLLVKQLKTKVLVIGYDHHFGRNREGSFEHLQEFGPLYGFDVEEIKAQDVNEIKVSSTKIRAALEEGWVEKANKLLGHPYRVTGKVVRGRQVGSKMGFPTANIEVEDPFKLIPLKGVYAVYAFLEGMRYKAMLNIGNRPTIEAAGEVTIEVHVLEFQGDLYGKELAIDLIARLRAEQNFSDQSALKMQLLKDKEQSLTIL